MMEAEVQNEFLPYNFPSRTNREVVIENVTVIPMDSNRTLHNYTVVAEAGKITRMGPSSDMPRPDGSTIVDGKGQYLMPGFSDMYTHYRDPSEAPLYLAYGITTARTGSNAFQVGMQSAINNGVFPSPWMIAVTQGIDGINEHGRTDMPTNTPLLRPEDAEALARKLVTQGHRQIVPFSLLNRECLTALGKACAELGVRMVGNCPNALSWEEAVACGMSGFQQMHLVARDHMQDQFGGQTYWDRFDPAPGTKLDFDKIRRLGGFLAKHQAWNLPTIIFHQRASQPADISLAHQSLRYVPQSTINDWESTIIRWGRRGHVGPGEWRDLARKRAENFHRTVGIFHEEGAPQLTCTDGLNPYNVQGDTLLLEIENFAAAGMSCYEALRCTTSEAARYMGEEDLWGTLATGKRANMVLLRENPLEDIKAVRSVNAVFVNGYYLDRAVLDDLLQQREQLAKGAPPVASTDLPASTGEGRIVHAGIWRETICDANFGEISYRHTQMPDGDMVIEERHAGANPRRHPERKSVRIRLDADLNMRDASFEVETFVGTESGTVTWTESEGYQLNFIAMDGAVSVQSLAGAARPPGEQMAVSFMPHLIRTRGAGKVQTVDVAGSTLGDGEVVLTQVHNTSSSTKEAKWDADISRLGSRLSQEYHLTTNGELSSMSETTILLWPRQLTPATADDI
jgi:hypothetical protein